MSDGENLWREDGTPRRKHPSCVFCGADEIESSFDDARCRGCGWKGSLLEFYELEFKRRPSLWLLDFLERREISLCNFGLWLGMGRNAQSAQSNVRQYTHPRAAGPAGLKSPSHRMVVRWAIALGVDAGSFYRSRTAKE
jgi:hypothetical protein